MIARLLLVVIGGYRRWISPALPPRCRFAPSCSAYAVEAIGTHGAARGSWLTVRRLLRCHPFHPGGHDPVPPPRARRPERSAPAVRSASVRTARGQVPRTPRRPRSRTGAPSC